MFHKAVFQPPYWNVIMDHEFSFDPWFVTALLLGLETALANLRSGNVVPPWDCHHRVALLYNWMDVASRTETVYHRVAGEKSKTLGSQLRRYMASGVLPFLLIISLAHLMLRFLDWMVPHKVSIRFTTSILLNISMKSHHESYTSFHPGTCTLVNCAVPKSVFLQAPLLFLGPLFPYLTLFWCWLLIAKLGSVLSDFMRDLW